MVSILFSIIPIQPLYIKKRLEMVLDGFSSQEEPALMAQKMFSQLPEAGLVDDEARHPAACSPLLEEQEAME